jgi:hypothetical protein
MRKDIDALKIAFKFIIEKHFIKINALLLSFDIKRK